MRQCLEEGLGRPLPDLEPSQRLVGDLGLDSLDLLDLIFRLERRFQVRINPKDYENRVKAELGDRPLAEEGLYTAEAAALLRRAMPCVPEAEIPEGLAMASLPEAFRVRTFMNMVLAARQKTAPAG
jgi:acyl carrier protein